MHEEIVHEAREIIGFTGRRLILAVGDDRRLETGHLIDAAELLRSPLFGRLGEHDRRLVIRIAASAAPQR